MKSPEVMAINPRGQMPSFKDGDVAVNESLAAMQYIDDTYKDVPLMPADSAARGLALQRFHEAEVLYTSIQPLFYKKMTGQVKTEAHEVTVCSLVEVCVRETRSTFMFSTFMFSRSCFDYMYIFSATCLRQSQWRTVLKGRYFRLHRSCSFSASLEPR